MFPESRKGCIDRNILQRLGIDAARMKFNDALLLYKLILTRYSVRKSVIRKDPQKYIYSEVEKWSKFYAAQLGIGGAYSKKFELVRIDELL